MMHRGIRPVFAVVRFQEGPLSQTLTQGGKGDNGMWRKEGMFIERNLKSSRKINTLSSESHVRRILHRAGRGAVALAVLAVGLRGAAAEHYHIDEGIAFHAYDAKGQGDSRQPLFRLMSPKDIHGFTSSESVRTMLVDLGMKPEDSGIYVLARPREGAKRLFQFMRKTGVKDGNIQTILTVSEEGRQDLLNRPDEFEEIAKEPGVYVFPPEFSPSYEHLTPVYCLRNPFTDERLYSLSRAEIDAVLSKWSNREKRISKEVAPLINNGRSLGQIVPVGLEGKVGDIAWRFEHDRELGKELEGTGAKAPKTKGAFVYVQVKITNQGQTPVEIKPPALLAGNPALRLPADIAATTSFVKENGFVFSPGAKLDPGASVQLRFVYDLPLKTKDVLIEAWGSDPNAKEVILLDTGR